MSASHYYLVRCNSPNVNAAGLIAGDVVRVDIRSGQGAILREHASAPPTAVRARLVAAGDLQRLDPLPSAVADAT